MAQDFSSKTLVYPFYPRTDGAIFKGITSDTTCVIGYTKTVRHVTAKMKKEIFKRYGVTTGHKRGYEVDHIISLQLGGSNELDNLYPQPYEVYLNVNGKDMRMGALEKDVVENALRRNVCKGKITLKEAQDIIVKDWITYYLKLKNKI
jgi:hypothetical protein